MENKLLTIKERKNLLEGITNKLHKVYSNGFINYFFNISNEEKIRIKKDSNENELSVIMSGYLDEVYITDNLKIEKGDCFLSNIKLVPLAIGIFEKRKFVYCGSIDGLISINNEIIYQEIDGKKEFKKLPGICLYSSLPKGDQIKFDQLIVKYSNMINKK